MSIFRTFLQSPLIVRWPRVVAAAIFAGGLTLAACERDVPTTAPTPSRSATSGPLALLRGSRRRRPDEDPFVTLANDIPESAGFHLRPDGAVEVFVTDSTAVSRARNALQRHLVRGDLGLPPGDRATSVKVVRYGFQQLSDWRDVAFDSLRDNAAFLSLDLDEVSNTVTLGVDRDVSGAEGVIRARLAGLGIPVSAVRIEFVGRAVATRGVTRPSAQTINSSLDGPIDTVGAGIMGSGCTIGMVADFYGSRRVSLASHCSPRIYVADGDVISISSPSGVQYGWGFESEDPVAQGDTCDLFRTNCGPSRQSDVALWTPYAGALPSQRGAIARPAQRTNGAYGSLTIATSTPWLYVVATEHGQPVGTIVEKIGRTTGWTYGAINASCADKRLRATNENLTYWVLCTTVTDANAGRGDSGGPFFALRDPGNLANPTVTLMGFDTGCTLSTNQAPNGQTLCQSGTVFYSGYRSFESDLGVLDYGYLNPRTERTLAAPTLTGTLSSGSAYLSWSAVALPGSTATQYAVNEYVEYLSVDEWGSQTDNTSSITVYPVYGDTTFTTGWFSLQSDCNVYAYPVGTRIHHFFVVATDQYMSSSTNEVCYQ